MNDPCGHLRAGHAAICRGERDDLPHDRRVAYLLRWYADGKIGDDALIAAGIDPDNLPSRGLGDTVAKIARKTGIARAVRAVEKMTGKPCGCSKRQAKLNEAMPFRPSA